MEEVEAISEIRKRIYDPLGYILEEEGDFGFIKHGPDIVKSLYNNEPELFSALAPVHAESGYTRKKIIYDDTKHAALLMEWCPNCLSPIHEHGGRVCFDIVIDGELQAINFKAERVSESTYRLKKMSSYIVRPGECVIVNPFESKSDIHMISSQKGRII